MSIKKMLLLMGAFVFLLSSAILSFAFLALDVKKTNAEADAVSEKISMKKICYLTFDDGPSENTEKVLDILKKYNIKATFFVIGSEIEEGDWTVLERMKKEGHLIGLHSNAHDFDKVYQGPEACVQDYLDEYELLKSEYGIETNIFRFPGGSACIYMNEEREEYIYKMLEKGFRCFDWHVSGEDSVGNPTVFSIQKNVLDHIGEYHFPIILLHDSKIADATVEALPQIIEELLKEEYSFQTLSEREEYIFRWKKENIENKE